MLDAVVPVIVDTDCPLNHGLLPGFLSMALTYWNGRELDLMQRGLNGCVSDVASCLVYFLTISSVAFLASSLLSLVVMIVHLPLFCVPGVSSTDSIAWWSCSSLIIVLFSIFVSFIIGTETLRMEKQNVFSTMT